jgi:hypothetical protein
MIGVPNVTRPAALDKSKASSHSRAEVGPETQV